MYERVDAHARATTTTGGADASGGGFSKKILGLKVRATRRDGTRGTANASKTRADALTDGAGDVGA